MSSSASPVQCNDRQKPQSLLPLAAIGVIISSVWAVVALYAIHAAMNHNVLRLPFEESVHTQFFLPEGWAFFTRNPRDDRYFVYRLAPDGSWIDTNLGPHNRPRNAFGLNRKSRAQGVEIGLLLVSIQDQEWTACRKSPTACLATIPVSKDFKDISPNPTLCGEMGVVMQPPVPWAWAGMQRPVTMPSRVSRVRVHC